jgi:hypothetical protein
MKAGAVLVVAVGSLPVGLWAESPMPIRPELAGIKALCVDVRVLSGTQQHRGVSEDEALTKDLEKTLEKQVRAAGLRVERACRGDSAQLRVSTTLRRNTLWPDAVAVLTEVAFAEDVQLRRRPGVEPAFPAETWSEGWVSLVPEAELDETIRTDAGELVEALLYDRAEADESERPGPAS